jgi:prepilin-type N-terminal cleavage/methylation domain-containing protein
MQRHPARSSAFTLVEILVAITLLGLVSTGLLRIMIQTLNTYSYDTGKILVNKDIRAFTTEMTENATYANYFMIFPSYTSISRTDDTLKNPDDPEEGFVNAIIDNTVHDGQSGDCLALVFKDPANDTKIERIIVYFRAPTNPSDPTSTGPVRRLIHEVSDDASSSVWKNIPEITNPSAYPEVVELSRGLANGKLFYNFYSRSIIVKGEILHRGSQTKQATNTYNFTVSPRG